jgi:glucose/arabinose dehydrogenase
MDIRMITRLKVSFVSFVSLLALTTAGCLAAPKPKPTADEACVYVSEGFGPLGKTEVKTEKVVTGLEVPWSIAFLPKDRLLVAERPGRVRLVIGGKLEPKPVAVIPVNNQSEDGLLGLALHPQFAKNRLFYIYYTVKKAKKSVNRIERYRLAADDRSAKPEKIILDNIPAAKNHSGGRLRFGPDGMLYAGTGDAQDPDLSQKKESLAGKILRMTPDGKVPPTNPFAGSFVYILGVRNIQAFDWIDSGTLWIADHGPSSEFGKSGGDEISIAKAGANLGWPTIWGCERKEGMITPQLVFKTAAPPGGAAIYRGDAIPEWKGSLLVGTLRSTHLHRVGLNPADRTRVAEHEVYLGMPNGHGRLREVISAPDGTIYLTTSNCDGRGECGPEKDSILRLKR